MVPAKVFVLIAIMATTLNVVQGATIINGKGVHVFASGDNLTLTCEYESSSSIPPTDLQKLKFYDKDDQEFGASRNFMQSHKTLSANKISVILTKQMVDRSDAGTYNCKFNNDNSKSFQTQVAIVHFTTVDDLYNMTAGEKQTNKLECKYTVEKESSLNAQSKVMWKMGDKAAESVSDRHKVNGTVLTIENAAWSDVGPYTCVVTVTWGGSSNPDNAESVTSIVPLRGAPKIGKMDSSKNVVQEDNVEITCDVSGYPYPTVNWFKDGKPLMPNKRITIIDNGMYKNAILSIHDLEFEDKGEYTCNATSVENPSGVTATIVIRVKDKLAALWPFLGIVAEVIVLCIIIFIYEKKRSREMEDEADGGDDVVNSDDHKGKDVRQPIIDGDGVQFFTENSTFELFCSYSIRNIIPDSLQFFDKNNNMLTVDRGFNRTIVSSSRDLVNVSLSKSRIQAEDNGRYTCKYGSGSNYSVIVAIVRVNTNDAIYDLKMENKLNYTLTCNIAIVLDPDPAADGTITSRELTWFKDGVGAENVSTRHVVNGTELTIIRAAWTDIGAYSCNYQITWGANRKTDKKYTVEFKGEPRMGSVPVSINLKQDEDLELTCPVSGYPYPTVTWQLDGVIIHPSSRRAFSADVSGMYENAILKVKSVQFEDRGIYTCTGSSELNNVTSSPTLVRVKDKYAAVWPFIGIVVEVVLLVAIIAFCERRKRKQMAETETEEEVKPTARRTSSRDVPEIRQRIISNETEH
uniref:Hemicentin-1-like n=1 Tax=Crassostrea virginica TaxID=6565 RepID=A0A8B8DY32_CRAVI|nr:hemicentin-1-like [Crassostrea virginica]